MTHQTLVSLKLSITGTTEEAIASFPLEFDENTPWLEIADQFTRGLPIAGLEAGNEFRLVLARYILSLHSEDSPSEDL